MCKIILRRRLEPSLGDSNHFKKGYNKCCLTLGYSQGSKLVLRGLCIIDAPDNNVEQILLCSVAYYGALLVNQYRSAAMEVCVNEVIDYPPCVSCGQNCAGYVEEFFAAPYGFVRNHK